MTLKEIPIKDKWILTLPGNPSATLKYCAEEWIACAQAAVDKQGFFSVALSGGSTPKLVYQLLTAKGNRERIPWEKVFLFWSDERSYPQDHPESNYHMAMVEGGFNHVPIPKGNIFRMVAEKEIEKNALLYEQTIKSVLKNRPFDLVLLGLGEDGHVASLFPRTKALHAQGLVAANYVPALNTHRMTLTFGCINQASQTVVYVMGSKKRAILESLLLAPTHKEDLPAQRLGSKSNPTQFIIDDEAAKGVYGGNL